MKIKNKIASLLTCAAISVGSFTPAITSSAATATLGDCNGDGVVNSIDAVMVLKDYANTLVGKKSTLSLSVADTNGDGQINSSDAVKVLIYFAGTMAGQITESFSEYSSHLLCDHNLTADFVSINQFKDGITINFKVHNSGKLDRIFQVWYLDANGLEITPICSMDIAAGKTTEDYVTVYFSEFEKVGLTFADVKYFTFSFHSADYESSDGSFKGSWTDHWDSSNVTLYLS